MNKEIDELDLKILRLLQNDARISLRAISERVFVSTPTVAARIEELTKLGVIKGYFTEIDASVFENVINAYIEIDFFADKKEKLYEFLNSSPQVTECVRVTGEYPLLIRATFKNAVEMDEFLNELLVCGKIKTRIAYNSVVNRRGATI